MKKLFISCPMKGRTEENIRKSIEKMHKIAEIVFDEKLEVIPSYIEDKPPKGNKEAVWYLGRSIQLLSEADYFIGIEHFGIFRGCMIENDIARNYEIPSTYVRLHELMPDALEFVEKSLREESCNYALSGGEF